MGLPRASAVFGRDSVPSVLRGVTAEGIRVRLTDSVDAAAVAVWRDSARPRCVQNHVWPVEQTWLARAQSCMTGTRSTASCREGIRMQQLSDREADGCAVQLGLGVEGGGRATPLAQSA